MINLKVAEPTPEFVRLSRLPFLSVVRKEAGGPLFMKVHLVTEIEHIALVRLEQNESGPDSPGVINLVDKQIRVLPAKSVDISVKF